MDEIEALADQKSFSSAVKTEGETFQDAGSFNLSIRWSRGALVGSAI